MTVSAAVVAVFLVLVSARCSTNRESADTVFADSGAAEGISKDTVSLLEGLQGAYRQVTSAVLPAVVTLDVVETRKVRVQDPFSDGFPWFFFGNPENRDEKNEPKEREFRAEGLGSGVIVRKTGKIYYVLTNYHVVGKANDIEVKHYDGRTFKGKLVGGDQRKDIALVSFETSDNNITVAKLGNSDVAQVGDIVFAIGSPLGYSSSVTQGIISAVGRFGGPGNTINDFIQTDAAINQGNSGGPMVNIYGEVIGINSWIASSSGGSQGLGFSIPINNVKKDIDSFIQYGEIKYGWLGVQLIGTDANTIAELGIPKNIDGALVAQIFLGSPADKGGMKPGDYVTKLNGKTVKDINQLVRDIGNLGKGQTASFVLMRNGKELSLNVKIDARDEKIVEDSAKLWPGVVPVPITDSIREQLKLKKNITGVIAANIQNKSPAAIMGLKSGDVITAVNDTKIANIKEFYNVISQQTKEVWFDVLREGQTLSTIRFKLSK
ncbi:peptidase Do [Treponema phagedenis F0421]|nr:peptidase Do [Treponema phagedenis F0421]